MKTKITGYGNARRIYLDEIELVRGYVGCAIITLGMIYGFTNYILPISVTIVGIGFIIRQIKENK